MPPSRSNEWIPLSRECWGTCTYTAVFNLPKRHGAGRDARVLPARRGWAAADAGGQENSCTSRRAYHCVLKLARTIADLAGAEDIGPVHLAEAIQCRPRRIE